jgi:hypothetical protein
MANWFARLMGSAPAPTRSSSTGRGDRNVDSSGFRPSAVHSAQQQMQRQSSTVVNAQRETLRTLVGDMLREHGIPPVWISTDVMTVSSQGRLVFQIILTLKFWDESLPLYFSAFEASYMTRVDSTNPELAEAVRSVSWRIAPDAACPYADMPDPVFWTEAVRQERVAAKRRLELNQLFEDEWREDQSGGPAFAPTDPVPLRADFEKTQPFYGHNGR